MLAFVSTLLLVTATPSPAALQVLQRHECARCHVVEGVSTPAKERSCAGCHTEIASSEGDATRTARGQKQYGEAWSRFVRRTGEHFSHVPALTSMSRFQASWLRTFLRSPSDLRPNLDESMIRHALTDAEIETLVKGWKAQETTVPASPPAPERVASGLQLLESKGCLSCHLFGSTGDQAFTPRNALRAMAPDLLHARKRLSRETIEQWIRSPSSVKPGTPMPAQAVTMDEAAQLADAIFFATPAPATPREPLTPPAFDPAAPVPSFTEVNDKVFRAVCWHCHSEPAFNHGDGGPGNTGGLGFKGKGLSFADYESIMNGSVSADGKRRSIFRPGESGEPVLLERLRQRYAENARDRVPPGQPPAQPSGEHFTTRGMPLGLPALTAEQFSLVERWVRGGHPGPGQ